MRVSRSESTIASCSLPCFPLRRLVKAVGARYSRAGPMILVVNNRSHFLPELLVRLDQSKTPHEILPNDGRISYEVLAQYEGVILSGGPLLLEQALYLADISLDLEVLMEAQVPVLGICLGYELIAATHGADIERLPAVFGDREEVRVLKKNDLFEGLPDTFTVLS